MSLDLAALRQVQRHALSAGAVAVEVFGEALDGVRAEVSRGKVLSQEPRSAERVVVRCWGAQGGVAEVSGTLVQVLAAISGTIAAADASPPNPSSGPERLNRQLRPLSLDDPRWLAMSPRDRVDLAVEAERAARRTSDVVEVLPFRWEDGRVWRGVVNSRELAQEEWGTELSLWASARLAGGQVLTRHASSRTFSTMASLPVGALLVRAASELSQLPDVTLPSSVICAVPPHCSAALVDLLAQGITTSSRGLWGWASRELVSLDANLHLLDDGTLPSGLRSRSFDERGVPPIPVVLMQGGRLASALLGVEEARARGLSPTGHREGGVVRPRNLALKAGSRSLSANLSLLSEPHLFLEHLAGLDQVDHQVGLLDLRATGWWVEGGRRVGRVLGVPLRGTVRGVFSEVGALASDTDRVGHVDAPALILRGWSGAS
ncbi:MAG: hypothetical protein JXX28_15285 [Deltaproteobacteria bacterium]|nr:hypothetical protein [Deltaproteobacteria bacterium]